MKTKINKPIAKNPSHSPFFSSPNNAGFFEIQAKLNISKPGDKLEEEADKVANVVVDRIPNEDTSGLENINKQEEEEISDAEIQSPEEEEIQPQSEQDEEPVLVREEREEEKPIQFQPEEEAEAEKIQMQPEEEEKIQPKASEAPVIAASISQKLKKSMGIGSPLSSNEKNEMEAGFGVNFSRVKIHTGSDAIQMNRQLHAQAFTHKADIYFNKDKYNPSDREGKQLLAHELPHTMQQGGQADNTVMRTPLSDELELLWNSGNKAAFFDRLRIVATSDIDLNLFVTNNLNGDDYWLAHNILIYGPEGNWPIYLRVEREMKGWSDCGGKGRVFEILRTANGAKSTNAQLMASLGRVFSPGTNDIWLANNLMLYGIETRWPLDLSIERAMKGWSDCGGATEVHNILRSVNGAEALNFRIILSIYLNMATSLRHDRWLALQLLKYGAEANFPMHVGIMNFFYSKGEEGPINTIINEGYTIKTFTGAFDTWRYHSDGRVVEVDISTNLLGNTDRTIQTIRLNTILSAESASMTLYHELAHVTSTEPVYLEQEIQVRIQSEQFAIDHGLPPTGTNTRKTDGTVNEAEIRRQIMGSTHYNPTNRSRIGRRYEGEVTIGPWVLPS